MNYDPGAAPRIELFSNTPEFQRPNVRGKFIYVGDEKFYVRGVTYGTFRPDENGNEFHDPEIVERDFSLISKNKINLIRTYSVPPLWLLDLAQEKGLYVMIGIPWEQHVTFLDEKKRIKEIMDRIRSAVNKFVGHQAVFCYTIGNEIPASIVRWYGHSRIENFLRQLHKAAKHEDSEALITYVNYPTTEYLDLPFLDFVSFNVYLETPE